jgi:hypothetical protein
MKLSNIIDVLKHINKLLAFKNYEKLCEDDVEKVLTPVDIKNKIEEYKGEITYPMENAFYDFYLYPIDKSTIAIEFDLWLDNSVSDLTLSCYISYKSDEYQFGLQDLRTL